MINGIGALGGVSLLPPEAGKAGGGQMPAMGAGPSFADALGGVAQNAIASLSRAETLSIGALQGEVAARDVADAVMSAEQSLQAAIAIRDKIVTAYLEVSRMAI